MTAFFAVPKEAQAHSLSCGVTVSTDHKLKNDIGPCAGDGLIIDTDNVVLNLKGKKIFGSGICGSDSHCFTSAFPQSGSGIRVAAGVTGVTIKNGKIEDSFRNGIALVGGNDGTVIEKIEFKDDLVFAINIFDSDDVTVSHNKMENLAGNGLDVIDSDGFKLVNNEIKTAGKARQPNGGGECGIGNGIFIGFGSDGFEVLNNSFEDISQSAILVWDSTNGLIDNNEVIKSDFLPCISIDFGAISIVAASTGTDISNNLVKDNENAVIGLRGPNDTRIHHNDLESNGTGIFLSGTPTTGTTAHNNCIKDNDIGLESSGDDHVANAENNYWGDSSGPYGAGPLGTDLDGDGDEIVQQATDDVDVEPFLKDCPTSSSPGA